jgi:hypothetical protein
MKRAWVPLLVVGGALGGAGVVEAQTSISLSGLNVSPTVRGGMLRGSIDAQPAGATVTLTAKAAGRRVGAATATATDGSTRFKIRLSRAAREKLAKRDRLTVTVNAALVSGGSRVGASQTLTVHRPR